MTRRIADQRGTVSAFIAVIAIGLVMVAGLAYDGGELVAAQSRARNVANGAARAGAQAVDTDALRISQGTTLDAEAASAAVDAFLAQAGYHGTSTIRDDAVTVVVSVQQPMRILPLRPREFTVVATARAVSAQIGGGR